MKLASALAGVVAGTAFASSLAYADAPANARPRATSDKAVCVDAAAQGQTLRDAHQIIEARVQFQSCARASCPSAVQNDCVTWLSELDRSLSTVVLSAKDQGGNDVLDVAVSLDGHPLVGGLDGQAIPINPGLHTFRFERAGSPAITEQLPIKEGERARAISVVFQSPPAVERASGSRWGTQRILSVVVGGAGVAGVVTGIAIALNAKVNDSNAAGEAGAARHTDSESAASEGNVATVVLSVGAALAATGVVLWFTAPVARTSVGTNGQQLILRGTF